MSRYGFATAALMVLLGTAGAGQQTPPSAAPPTPQKPAEAAQAPPPRTPAQLVNIRLDLTIKEQRGAGPMQSRVVTLLLGDRENGRVRSGQGNAMLNVDARPEILRDGKIRVSLALEYRPIGEGEKATTLLTESLSILLDDGKPLMVSQSADPTSEHSGVSVEVKATLAK